MNRTPVKRATIEDILHDICYYEDPDSSLLISTTKNGGVFVSDQEWRSAVSAPTMKEALIKFQIKSWEELGYNKKQAQKAATENFGLDWCAAISRLMDEEKAPSGDQAH